MMDPRPEQAADWFRNLTGVEFPQPKSLADLRLVKRNIWSSHVTSQTKVLGLPHFLSVRPAPSLPATLRVLGYGGRGINRQAVYYTVVDSTTDLRLRVPFGGLLMDPAERRQAVLADLTLAEWLHARTRELPVQCLLRFGQADREIRIVALGERRRKLYESFHARNAFDHAAVKRDLEHVFGYTSRLSADSTEPT
jgi:hypothetical protein